MYFGVGGNHGNKATSSVTVGRTDKNILIYVLRSKATTNEANRSPRNEQDVMHKLNQRTIHINIVLHYLS